MVHTTHMLKCCVNFGHSCLYRVVLRSESFAAEQSKHPDPVYVYKDVCLLLESA